MSQVLTLVLIAVAQVLPIACCAQAKEPAASAPAQRKEEPLDLLPAVEYGFRTVRVNGECTLYKGVVLEMNDEIVTVLARETKVTSRWFSLNPFIRFGGDFSSAWKPLDQHVNLRAADISFVWMLSAD